MEEAEAAGAKLRKQFFDVRNLEGSHFLDSKGKQKLVTSEEFSKRPEDLAYFVFLVNVDPTVVDTRIIQESLSTGFSLKLPLSVYDVTMDTVIKELRKRRIDRNGTTGLNKLIGSADLIVLSSLKKALFGTIDPGMTGGGGVGSTTPPSPGRSPTAGGTAPATPAALASQAMGQAPQSPKMSRLMRNNSNVST